MNVSIDNLTAISGLIAYNECTAASWILTAVPDSCRSFQNIFLTAVIQFNSVDFVNINVINFCGQKLL